MSWGSGFAALLGAGALFWTIGNSVRRDTKAEVASLADSTDRKIAANADAIAAMREDMAKGFAAMREVHDRDMGAIREAQAKSTANIINLEKSIDKLEVKLDKLADDTAKGFAELRDSHQGRRRTARSRQNQRHLARIHRPHRRYPRQKLRPTRLPPNSFWFPLSREFPAMREEIPAFAGMEGRAGMEGGADGGRRRNNTRIPFPRKRESLHAIAGNSATAEAQCRLSAMRGGRCRLARFPLSRGNGREGREWKEGAEIERARGNGRWGRTATCGDITHDIPFRRKTESLRTQTLSPTGDNPMFRWRGKFSRARE